MRTVLYNNCYGGFNFSEEFVAEYEKRVGHRLDTYQALFRMGEASIRCDTTAVAIFREKGGRWCSGIGSRIEAYEFPAIFARYWEIEDYEGDERVRILVSEALADILHEFMTTNDRAELDRQYAAITAAAHMLNVDARVTTPPPEHDVPAPGEAHV